MILIYVLLAVLLVTAAAMICMMVFGMQKNKTYRFWTRVGVIASAMLVTFCLVLGSIYSHDVTKLQTQYNDIMLYHDVVSNCENEQVRFGHYEKIADFNSAYNRMVAIENDNWFGGLLPSDWSKDMSVIEFYFRGVNYEPVYD